MCVKEEVEEAIETIRDAFDIWESEYEYDTGRDWSKQHKARDMAIKALEQEPCEDVKEKILYDLEHPDLQNERRYGFEGGLMYAREVIEKYL